MWAFKMQENTRVLFNKMRGQKSGQNLILFAEHCLEPATTDTLPNHLTSYR